MIPSLKNTTGSIDRAGCSLLWVTFRKLAVKWTYTIWQQPWVCHAVYVHVVCNMPGGCKCQLLHNCIGTGLYRFMDCLLEAIFLQFSVCTHTPWFNIDDWESYQKNHKIIVPAAPTQHSLVKESARFKLSFLPILVSLNYPCEMCKDSHKNACTSYYIKLHLSLELIWNHVFGGGLMQRFGWCVGIGTAVLFCKKH